MIQFIFPARVSFLIDLFLIDKEGVYLLMKFTYGPLVNKKHVNKRGDPRGGDIRRGLWPKGV